MPSPYTRLRAALDPLARRIGGYTAYRLSSKEYIDSHYYYNGVEGARASLQDAGYEPQYLSAAKRHPETGQLHDLSYRRVPHLHPDIVADTRLAREWSPQACQYHVHAFRRENGVFDVHCHYELRPDLLSPSPSLERLRTHYSPSYGETYHRGVYDPALNGGRP